jgi:hypothetical protein
VAYKQHVNKELVISDADLVFVGTLHYQPTTLKSGISQGSRQLNNKNAKSNNI